MVKYPHQKIRKVFRSSSKIIWSIITYYQIQVLFYRTLSNKDKYFGKIDPLRGETNMTLEVLLSAYMLAINFQK